MSDRLKAGAAESKARSVDHDLFAVSAGGEQKCRAGVAASTAAWTVVKSAEASAEIRSSVTRPWSCALTTRRGEHEDGDDGEASTSGIGANRAVHRHIREGKTMDVFHYVFRCDVIEAAALEVNAGDIASFRKPGGSARIWLLRQVTSRISMLRTSGRSRTLRAFFVGKVDLKHRVRDFADFDFAEEDVLDGAAAHGVAFEAEGFIQVGAVEPAVLEEHIAHAAGDHFASDGQRAVAIFHVAIPDDYVFAGDAHAAAIAVATGFDGDAIVAGIEGAVLYQYVACRNPGSQPSLFGPWLTILTPRTVTLVQSTGLISEHRRILHGDAFDEDVASNGRAG